MERVYAALADRLSAVVSAAAPGHCVRIDDVAQPQAERLATLMADRIDPAHVKVAVLDTATKDIRVDVETAVGIRNDKTHVFALLVPPGQAHAASSLDNSFNRLPLVAELDEVVAQLTKEVANRWPALPVRVLIRDVRASLESKLSFLSAVLDSETDDAFGRELWRVGLLVDDSTGATLRTNLDWNHRLVAAVVSPATVATTLRERLNRAGVAPGDAFEAIISALTASSDVRDSTDWTRRLMDDHGLKLTDIPQVNKVESALESVEVQSFRKPGGGRETFSKLKETDEGALYAETSAENPGVVGLRWKSRPPKPLDVAHWLLELLPPADLRDDDTPSVIEMKVKGTRASAQLKLELGADDLSGGSLFVVRLTALDANATPMLLANGTLAVSESDQFEIVIQEALADRSTRKASAASLAGAQLKAVLAGASDTAIDMESWDLAGGVYTVRVGKHLASQIRVAPVVIGAQRRIIAEPAITALTAESRYGQAILPDDMDVERFALPNKLTEKRRELLALLGAASSGDVPEVFAWNQTARIAAAEYAQTYKRTLDRAVGESRDALLRMDTLCLEVGTASGTERAVVVLPIHPLRIAWIAAHHGVVADWCIELLKLGGPKARSLAVDEALFSRVQPTNLPFIAVGRAAEPYVYFDELAHGCAVLLDPAATNPEAIASTVYSALGSHRESTATTSASGMVARRLTDFRRSHPEATSLRIAALNPGDGEILGLGVESVIATDPDTKEIAETAPPRVEVTAYGRGAGYSTPLARLAYLQRKLQLAQVPGRRSHLAPPLGLAMRPPSALLDDALPTHVALVQDVATHAVQEARTEGSSRQTAFQDLLTPAITTRVESAGKPTWVTSPALSSTTDTAAKSVVDAHESHQSAVGRALGLDGPPALGIAVEPEALDAIRTLHELSDWVMTLDRYVGLDLYEDPLSIGLGTSNYVLDYAPDFIEGLSHRLTVTTKHRGEVTRILSRAMDELGLDAVNQSVTPILENLLSVSGRLVLRLQGSESFAREAVSLAALISHLRARDQLQETIIVPIDTHQEIFGRAARDEDGAARRCDMLLVKVDRRGLRFKCVEVKSRKSAALPVQLADDIVDQVEGTRRLLVSRFFAIDPPRVDARLQRSRLAGILHYYADRAVNSGTLSQERLAETHAWIDRHLELEAAVEITTHGYVISLQGSAGFPTKHRQVPITVLTASDLGAAGFTTKFDEPPDWPDNTTPDAAPGTTPAPVTGCPKNYSSPSATVRGGAGPDLRSDDSRSLDRGNPTTEPSKSQLVEGNATGHPESGTQMPIIQSSDALEANPPLPGPHGQSHGQPLEDATPGPDGQPHNIDSASAGDGDRSLQEEGAITSPQVNSGSTADPDEDRGVSNPQLVEVILGKDAQQGDIVWPVSTKGSPHAFLLGIPGQGKSVTTRHIVREFAQAGLPSLLLDFHGDMAAAPPKGADVIDASLGLPFSPFEPVESAGAALNMTAFETAEVIAYVADLGEIQQAHVYKALQQAYTSRLNSEGPGAPTVEQFADALEDVEVAARGKHARERVRPLTDFGLFSNAADSRFDARAHGTVIDVSGIGLHQVQVAASAFLLRRIYKDMFFWPQDGTLKLAIVLDEAHRLAKDITLPRLMKEGRKYGVCVVVASQGTSDFHKDVLNNAGTKVVFCTNSPESKAVAAFLRGRPGQNLAQEIERLSVGQAYVSTPDLPESRKTFMTQ